MNGNAVIVFVKNPELGKVKTRLGETIGHEKALRIYKKLIQITMEAVNGTDATVYVYYSDSLPEGEHPVGTTRVQSGRGLGERMKNAFLEVFGDGAKQAVIIGSDCPEMSCAILDEAFSMLGVADVALGPANDGGYYLLGMKRLNGAFFENKEWSTALVLEQTLADIRKLGLSYAQLPELTDLDTIEDLAGFPGLMD